MEKPSTCSRPSFGDCGSDTPGLARSEGEDDTFASLCSGGDPGLRRGGEQQVRSWRLRTRTGRERGAGCTVTVSLPSTGMLVFGGGDTLLSAPAVSVANSEARSPMVGGLVVWRTG